MPNPDIAKHASVGGRAKAALRLRAEDVVALGPLKEPGDAKRWLAAAFEWAATGKVPGSRALAMVGAIREWGKLHETEATFAVIERLRADVAALAADRDRLAQEVERLELALAQARRTA